MKKRNSIFVLLSILFTILLFIVLSLMIEFPEVAQGSAKISPKLIRQKIVAKSSGNLRLIKSGGSKVMANDVVAYISNGLDLAEINAVDSILKKSAARIKNGGFVKIDLVAYDLAFLEPYLSPYVESQQQLQNFVNNQADQATMNSYRNNIIRDEEEVIFFDRKRTLLKEQSADLEVTILKYEKLLAKQLIKEQELLALKNRRNALLHELYTLDLKKVELSHHAEELSDKIHIMESESIDSKTRHFTSYRTNFNRVHKKFNEWRNINLLTAKVDGTVQYLKEWKEYDFIKGGDELMNIYPQEENIIADGFIEQRYISRLEEGQDVLIMLSGYSYLEYGKIKGKLQKYSPISNEEGLIHITVSLDYPITTTTGKEIEYFPDVSGSVQVVFENKKIINFLLDNFFDKIKK